MKEVADGSRVGRVDRIGGGMAGMLVSMKTPEGMIRWFARQNARGNPSQGHPTRISAGLALESSADLPQAPLQTGKNSTEETSA